MARPPVTPVAEPDLQSPDLRTIRLILEYDGTDFAGWQIQPGARTVQGELARALEILLREPVQPVGAGRTDAGTHALGQVAHLRTRNPMAVDRLLRNLNGLLPRDVAVRRAEEAPADFHARYSALGKRYRYRIRTAKAALHRRFVWEVRHPLDVERMREAARCLPGSHTFGAFCKQDPVPDSLLCTVADFLVVQRDGEVAFEIEADRFLRHMVRVLVGTLVETGGGRRPVHSMAELLRSGSRKGAGITAPARGLCLLEVYYADAAAP